MQDFYIAWQSLEGIHSCRRCGRRSGKQHGAQFLVGSVGGVLAVCALASALVRGMEGAVQGLICY